MTNHVSTPELPEIQTDLEARKREIAHRLWEENGRPDGKAEEHWAQACLILMDLGAGPVENPIWLQKQAEDEVAENMPIEIQSDETIERSIQSLKKRIAG